MSRRRFFARVPVLVVEEHDTMISGTQTVRNDVNKKAILFVKDTYKQRTM